jgi:hypothetical protein
MQYIAAAIHNNTLGNTHLADSEEEAKNMVLFMAEQHFQRALTAKEKDDLEEVGEIYNDSDADSIVTFTVGIID